MVMMVSQMSMAIVHRTISSVTISMSIVVKGIDVDTGVVMIISCVTRRQQCS